MGKGVVHGVGLLFLHDSSSNKGTEHFSGGQLKQNIKNKPINKENEVAYEGIVDDGTKEGTTTKESTSGSERHVKEDGAIHNTLHKNGKNTSE